MDHTEYRRSLRAMKTLIRENRDLADFGTSIEKEIKPFAV